MDNHAAHAGPKKKEACSGRVLFLLRMRLPPLTHLLAPLSTQAKKQKLVAGARAHAEQTKADSRISGKVLAQLERECVAGAKADLEVMMTCHVSRPWVANVGGSHSHASTGSRGKLKHEACLVEAGYYLDHDAGNDDECLVADGPDIGDVNDMLQSFAWFKMKT